jgi:hypothetical protein
MSIGLAPICSVCTHYLGGAGLPCDAFPSGIPDAILSGKVDHRKPVLGDKGIQFEQNPDSDFVPAEIDGILTLRSKDET